MTYSNADEAAACGMSVAYFAATDPDRPAVLSPTGGDRTYAQLNARANRLARAGASAMNRGHERCR
jgi:non-ribosomal peptide synthetase component F